MIDASTESLIPFQQAGRHIPGNPSVCTLHRWRLKGVRGAKLETLLVGGIRFTSKEAIERFIAAQNACELPPAITPQQRARQSATARRVLEDMGI